MKKFFEYCASYWIVGIVIILLGIDICCHIKSGVIVFESDHIILTFVGILATFVVVGNYAQVKEIESKVNTKVNNIDSNISKIENIVSEVDEIKKQVYGDIANSIITNSYNIEREINKDTAFDFTLYGIVLLLKNNIDYCFDYCVGADLIHRFNSNQKISNDRKNDIVGAINNTTIKSEGLEALKKYISELTLK